MQTRYLMTTRIDGRLVPPVPEMPGGVSTGWKLIGTCVTLVDPKRSTLQYTWTWERT